MSIMLYTAEEQKTTDQSGQTALVEAPSTSPTVPLPVADFVKFPKIPRFEKLSIIVTEKIDGTNAQIVVPEDPSHPILVGSRNRWITPGKGTDNFGFAAWAYERERELRLLGTGTHYGEWYGQGIGRGYGMDHREWLLFNIHRPLPEGLCPGIGIVPLLYHRQADMFNGMWGELPNVIRGLRQNGSRAVPGYMNPEGVVISINGDLAKLVFSKTGPSPEE